MRKYSKRTKSTKAKTYQDYLNARKELSDKGFELKEEMNKQAFDAYYQRLIQAKKSGEIKSTAWQTLLAKEKYVSIAQASALAKAATVALDHKVTANDIRHMSKKDIKIIGEYLNEHKTEDSLFGGKYE